MSWSPPINGRTRLPRKLKKRTAGRRWAAKFDAAMREIWTAEHIQRLVMPSVDLRTLLEDLKP